MRRIIAVIATGSAALGLVIAVAPAAQAAASAGSVYTPLSTPARVANAVAVGSHKTVTRSLQGVPSAATAVALNVTAAGGTAHGYLTAYEGGTSRPGTSSVNFAAHQTVANSAVVSAGGDASVTVYNGASASAKFYLDVTGYWTPASAGQGSFGSIAPTRVLSTPAGVGAKGPIGSHRTVSFAATGGATGIPSSASAVLINVTAATPTKAGYLTAYAGARPAASTVNFAAGATLAHLTVVPVSSSGRVSVYNGSSGTVQAFGDVLGWFAGGDPTAAGALGVLNPYRELSSKTIGSHKTVSFNSSGRGGVPKAGVRALALNVRVASAANRGYLAVDPGSPVSTSNLNFAKGQSIANLVLARASSGSVRIYNGSSSSIVVSADVTGYVLSGAITAPTVSSSHYVRTTDPTVLSNAGTADADNGSTFVVLDLGAQLNDKTGVELSATDIKITYANARALVQDYLNAYANADESGRAVTVAVATNSSADFSAYYATDRGSDWATKMIEPLRSSSPTSATVVGADDIEPGFQATSSQARNWETYYLSAAAAAGDSTSKLYFIGSADGCPTAYGQTGRACANTFTQASLFTLAGGNGSGRIRALPQIYTVDQGIKWANIAATGGSTAGFVGALTERGACPSATSACGGIASFTATQGFAAMYHAMSTVTASPTVHDVTDLDILR